MNVFEIELIELLFSVDIVFLLEGTEGGPWPWCFLTMQPDTLVLVLAATHKNCFPKMKCLQIRNKQANNPGGAAIVSWAVKKSYIP